MPVDVVRHVDTPLDGTAPARRLRLRLLRGVDAAVVLRRPAVAARPRRRVGARPPPRRRRARPRAGTSTASCCTSATRSPTRSPRAEHLVAERLRRRATALAIRGGSAGGLLVGACITMRPDLFARAVAEVPFVDVVTTMSDATLPLTVNEWEEWGDPRVEPYASYMLSYSPYDNTGAGRRTRRSTSPPASTTRGSATTSRRSGSPAARRRRRRDRAARCCAPRWAPATAARAAATRPGATRPAPSPSCCTHAVRRLGGRRSAAGATSGERRSRPALRSEVALAERALRPRAEAGARRVTAVDELAGDRPR